MAKKRANGEGNIDVYKRQLWYASSFLQEAKNVSATALSCGRAVAEKYCFTSHLCSSTVNVADVYCLPWSL